MARRMRFITWAKKDPNDESRIVYTFKTAKETMHFTSDDYVNWSIMERIRQAWIEDIKWNQKGGFWDVVLYED